MDIQQPVYHWDFSITDVIIQSQENFRYFWSDKDSRTRITPASGKIFLAERRLGENYHVFGGFSLPLKDEVVIKNNEQFSVFNFSKSLSGGLDFKILEHELSEHGWLESRFSVGILTPASYRFGKYVIPVVGNRLRISFANKAGLTVNAGYAGIVTVGSFFFSYGLSYRL